MQNEIITGKCVDISSEGKGVVKHFNDVVFVDGLFPNEEAEIEILYKRAGVYFGKVRKLFKKSPNRIDPKCKVCTSCGGCQYQQIDYKYQLEFKTNRVKNAIKRIGNIDTKVNDCIGMKDPYNYRNKIQVPFKKDKKGKVVFGFYKENSHNIIIRKECFIENKKAAPILWDIKLLLEKFKIPTYDEDNKSGVLRYVLIRTSYHFDDLMVVLVTNKENFPGQRNFINELVKLHPEITTIVENINTRHTNVILGEKEHILYGPGVIRDNILDLTFEISASSFFQVNPQQVEVLYAKALDLIDEEHDKLVLDAYSGVGTIGLIASKNAMQVISVEINKEAHLNAIQNAKRNNINNIKFVNSDAGKYIETSAVSFDVVIMDPPRSGSDERFLSTLIKNKTKKIIYISCDPETLARDLKYLSSHYEVNYIQPVDMFPMTCHVETVTSLILKK